jgi:urease accessory protein
MARDAAAKRGDMPTVFVSLTSPEGAAPIAEWIRAQMQSQMPARVAG